MIRFVLSAALALSLPLAAGCGGKEEAPAAGGGGGAPAASSGPQLDPQAVAKAEEIYVQRCTPCHGEKGHGDGSASSTLNPKPRNFGDPEWQKSVTDDHIVKIIKMGGAAVGKSAAMPSNPDLMNSNQVVAALKNKVRGFSGK